MLCSYQLHVLVTGPLALRVGSLGWCDFPAGRYVYTGSARRNLSARLARHLGSAKRRHWHIDYLLGAPGVTIETIATFSGPECVLNSITGGRVVIPRFGASDCRFRCGSHLKYFGLASPCG